MVTRRLCFLVLACGLLFAAYTDSQSTDVSSDNTESTITKVSTKSTEISEPPKSSATEPTKPTATTTAAAATTTITTTPTTPITPTSASISSTAHSSTTHVSSITSKPSTSTITSAPVTTTAKPQEFTWDVKNVNGTVCLKLHMKAYFKNKNNPKEKQMEISTNATVNNKSNCNSDNETQVIILDWSEESMNFKVSYTFGLDLTDKDKPKYYLKHLEFVNGTSHEFNGTTSTLTAHEGKSYKCNAAESHDLSGDVSVSWNDVQLQAYMEKRTDKKEGFSDAEDCPADTQTSDIVPIAVGCALAGLVVVVLIAYLVGRRRSRQKGYQSV